MTIPPSSPRDPLALDTRGILLELHLIRSGASRATYEIAVYLPGTTDAYGVPYAYDELDEMEREQAVIALCSDLYDYIARLSVEGQFAIYDATSPAVIAGLLSAWYGGLHWGSAGLFALTLSPEQARERNVPEAQRYVLRMREGNVPVHWELSCANGRPLTVLGRVDKRATTRRKRSAIKLADQVVRATTIDEVAFELTEFIKLEAMRAKWQNEDGTLKPHMERDGDEPDAADTQE